MALVDLDGTLDGVGDVLAPLVAWVFVGGDTDGSSSVSVDPTISFLMGGQVYGVGTVVADFSVLLGGNMAGVGDISGDLSPTYNMTGVLRGVGNIGISVPMPLSGFGDLQAYVEVRQAPDPACPCDAPPIKTFSYMHMLQVNDLTLCITDASGNPYGPPEVTYAIYEILPGGSRKLRGPSRRTPSSSSLGHYHATGYLGDCGQPGNWMIIWTYIENGVCRKVEEPFVLEAGAPMEPPCGCAPTGWD